MTLARALLGLALLSAACSNGGESDGSAPRAAAPQGGACDKICTPGLAGIRFTNDATAIRTVYVDGAQVCVLDPGAQCEASIPSGQEATIHVTDADDHAVCDDPHASLVQCACLNLEIHC